MPKQQNVEQIAETHYFIRKQIEIALKSIPFSANDLFPLGVSFSTYYEYYQARYADRFFDMSTLVRLGTAVETGLRNVYMKQKGHANLAELQLDPDFKRGIFQRIQTPHGANGAIELFQKVAIDLNPLPCFKDVQELMIHRHLYAHNSGVIDDGYISDIQRLTGFDIKTDPSIGASYPAYDCYWFEPLTRITAFIEAARTFFTSLP